MNILKDKQTKKDDYISRYAGVYFYFNTSDSKYMYGLTKQILPNTNYIIHTVQQYDTLDSLARYYYGRPDLFWVIAKFNNINDSFIDLFEHGYSTLKIPPISNIHSSFNIRG